MIGVVWEGVPEFGRALTHLDEATNAASKKASLVAGRELARAAAAVAPKGATEKLAGSMTVQSKLLGDRPLVQVGPTIVYGRRNDLGFKGRKSARGVKKRRAAGIDTGRRGLQPTKGSHFLEHALAAATPRIAEIHRRAWADAITKF